MLNNNVIIPNLVTTGIQSNNTWDKFVVNQDLDYDNTGAFTETGESPYDYFGARVDTDEFLTMDGNGDGKTDIGELCKGSTDISHGIFVPV